MHDDKGAENNLFDRALDELVEQKLIHIVGYEDGEPIYQITPAGKLHSSIQKPFDRHEQD